MGWPRSRRYQPKTEVFPKPPELDPRMFLPETRPHVLTPSSSCEDLASATQTGDVAGEASSRPPKSNECLKNFGLFQRLPWEVRHMILVAAFGDRRLHMELFYDHPLAPTAFSTEVLDAESIDYEKEKKTKSGLPVFNGRYTQFNIEPIRRGDATQPKRWQWFSCVCQRPTDTVEFVPPQMHQSPCEPQPCDDRCLHDALNGTGELEPRHGHRRPSRLGKADDSDLSIGIMGWLLSCRSAYAEGIDVLYSTNAFHILSLELMLSLPRLVLPQKLAKITSLELIWNLSVPYPRVPPQPWRRMDFVGDLYGMWQHFLASVPIRRDVPLYWLCRMVPVTFSHIEDLYIGFQNSIDPPMIVQYNCHMVAVEALILRPIEDMLRALVPVSDAGARDPKRKLRIAIERTSWMAWRDLYQARYKKQPTGFNNLEYAEAWKTLVPGPLGRQKEQQVKEGEREQPGYWLCTSWFNENNVPICFCGSRSQVTPLLDVDDYPLPDADD